MGYCPHCIDGLLGAVPHPVPRRPPEDKQKGYDRNPPGKKVRKNPPKHSIGRHPTHFVVTLLYRQALHHQHDGSKRKGHDADDHDGDQAPNYPPELAHHLRVLAPLARRALSYRHFVEDLHAAEQAAPVSQKGRPDDQVLHCVQYGEYFEYDRLVEEVVEASVEHAVDAGQHRVEEEQYVHSHHYSFVDHNGSEHVLGRCHQRGERG
mmetsp:Transcript_13405/g.29622  ORF Transcript_13405/g.29622 Transcript_13405/m.29622 type:complete len:207 (-) Transcript_13405:510-1130(-)